jgi:exodeoxyribonuclease VII large subunit
VEEKRYLTVTALTKYIKYKFDQDAHLKNVLLKGEISNFKHHSRGHFYFTLKDDKAQISAIMFASNSKNVLFLPKDGMSVLIEGYITVYEASGNYQIYVNKMSEDGLGDLYLAYEQLKKKLSDEGLFDPSHKKPIPRFPKQIAVLTSPTGAAVQDIIHIVNRRFPLTKIILYPTLVQGPYAKENIVQNIRKVNEDGLCDVIILGRGGGSIEDLWPFNEELVAYEIFASKIPIISSVGHETDFTISDFVADLRAPTPSGGAEIAVPDKVELMDYVHKLQNQSILSIKRILSRKQDQMNAVKRSFVFQDPLRLTEKKSRNLDHLMEKLRLLHPGAKLRQSNERLLELRRRVDEYYKQILKDKKNQFALGLNKLELVNPLAIMKKGYSVTRVENKIIKSVKDIQMNETIQVDLVDGKIEANVTSIKEEK